MAVLGKGHNTTYLYKHTENDTKYAVREIVAQRNNEYSDAIQKLEDLEEIKKMNHPNILVYHGICFEKGRVHSKYKNIRTIYIFTEIAVKSFEEHLDQSQKDKEYLTLKNAKRLITSLLSSLASLHQKLGLPHGDIKPSNILIMEDGSYKISDLGEVKNILKRIEYKHAVESSLNYLAPELFEMFGKRSF